MLTRKHFEAIAAAISDVRKVYEPVENSREILDSLTYAVSYAVGQFNGRFDREKFLRKAGYVPPEVSEKPNVDSMK